MKWGAFYHRWVRRLVPPISVMVVILLLVLMYLISESLRRADQPEHLYLTLLGLSAVGILFLAVVVLGHILRLVTHYRRGTPGARLTARLVLTFVGLTSIPVLIVFYFSVSFIQRGIDSWFDVQVEQAMSDALSLSQMAFDGQMRTAMEETKRAAQQLKGESGDLIALDLNSVRRNTGAHEMTIFGSRNLIVASASDDLQAIVPSRPDETALSHARSGKDFIGLDPGGGDSMRIRVVVPLTAGLTGDGSSQVLQALYAISPRANQLSSSVQAAFNEYRSLIFLHKSLKKTFTFALTLALLLSLLTAVWLAFIAARKLLAPIRELAAGTRAVAEGDYSLRLPVDRRDDLGQLVQSFNTMTARVRRAHQVMQQLQEVADQERDYLETVIQHLSSGVLTLSLDGRITRSNSIVTQLLSITSRHIDGCTLREICQIYPHLEPICGAFGDLLDPGHLSAGATVEAQVRIMTDTGRRVLLSRVAALPTDDDTAGGFVIVFEDITALIQAQRDAAWSEVARRLAHEIKNPLTPIQLSAERMRRRLLGTLTDESAQILDRSTQTIISQVEAMKLMVNEFAEYARSPQMTRTTLNLDELVAEVIDLYKGGDIPVLHVTGGEPLQVRADAGRIRQVLHNLIRNAQQALTEWGDHQSNPLVTVTTGLRVEGGLALIELTIADNGPGIPEAMLDRLFEPYATTRPKGSGLGLAIVKKIVEEHGGVVTASNRQDSIAEWERHGQTEDEPHDTGARIVIHLPLNVDELIPAFPEDNAAREAAPDMLGTGHNVPQDLFRTPQIPAPPYPGRKQSSDKTP
ncbi:MAG: ATP-binding protein [Halothiobacillus sp.]|jgi:nitrogen fixation/metabolism regulation signal transduction histidine kinase|uniref:sensor histidine kinase n=1 Tax=Halothiobacillus sp. TaxID=1891311 RepID=UPI002AD36F89|nr:ATP-binding protein [Halothiobacillus sp.]MDA3876402.1 ATP-binding protein [Halothiobacillus sp.]